MPEGIVAIVPIGLFFLVDSILFLCLSATTGMDANHGLVVTFGVASFVLRDAAKCKDVDFQGLLPTA